MATFTRTKNNNNSANHKNYITNVETLIHIIKGWIERSKSKEFVGGGGGEGGGGGVGGGGRWHLQPQQQLPAVLQQ